MVAAVTASAVLGVAQADMAPEAAPVEIAYASVDGEPIPQMGAALEVAKEDAFEEAEQFSVGDDIIASAELIITEASPDPEVVEIAEDPDFIAEQTLEEENKSCCPEGAFCCGMELGCIPDALAPDVMCPVQGPDSPVPCCTRRLF